MGYAASRTMRGYMIALVLFLSVAAAAGLVATAGAQGTGQIGRLYITGSNTEGFPSVRLQVYGYDGQGAPIDFGTEPLAVSHDGFPVDEVVFDGKTPVGTLTVFLIDAAGGTSDQLPAIQSAIQQYAAPPNMQEQVDYVAVYQIRGDGPQQLLAPTQFHNGVANLFNTTPLAAEEGATSLYDSLIDMIGQIDGLRPRPGMASSIVLISDGTDPGMGQSEPPDVTLRAADAGVPVHTLHLENPALGVGLELGRTYMQDLATGSRGVAAELASPEGLAAVWANIASFRDHSWIRYTVPEVAGGTVPVEVRLVNNPDVRAGSEVTISTAAPNVVINLPRESRNLTVPDLDDPVRLQLSTEVSWLDGQEREVVAAQLLVNNTKVADIPIDRLSSFVAAIPNLVIGDNRLEVVAVDSQGITSTSAPVFITVSQGESLEVPEALQPSGSGFRWSSLLWLLVLAGLAAAGYWWWRNRAKSTGEPVAPRSRRRRRGGSSTDYPSVPTPMPGVETRDEVDFMKTDVYQTQAPFVMAHLEVLSAQTVMPEEINLGDAEVHIGRSPAQSHVAFRDDITVSRLHAVLRLEGSRYRIYDAGSTSGTYVNDRQVPEYGLQLADGDEIQLGAVRLLYRQL